MCGFNKNIQYLHLSIYVIIRSYLHVKGHIELGNKFVFVVCVMIGVQWVLKIYVNTKKFQPQIIVVDQQLRLWFAS